MRGSAIGSGSLGQVLTILLCAGVVLAIVSAADQAGHSNDAANESEAQASLHDIQLAVELYAIDHQAAYPPYLIGGAAKAAHSVSLLAASTPFHDIRDCDRSLVSDPLLREGYIEAYPRNPFVRSGIAIHSVQENLPSSGFGDDPLRNGYRDGETFGTRFGPDGTTMGSVLADPRYAEWSASSATYPTWATIEYEFWDMWQGDKPQPYLPGDFFYKSLGELMGEQAERSQIEPIVPARCTRYIMGVYGGVHTKGKDILGQELPLLESKALWPWTRSEVAGNSSHREGSPCGAATTTQPLVPTYGNPNGIRDAIILVLTDGS